MRELAIAAAIVLRAPGQISGATSLKKRFSVFDLTAHVDVTGAKNSHNPKRTQRAAGEEPGRERSGAPGLLAHPLLLYLHREEE